jgi:hypothetical protein
MINFKTVTFEEAAEKNFPLPWNNGEDWDFIKSEYDIWIMCGIWEFDDKTPVKCIATDGGEPEDNSFLRDGSWIAPALTKMYRRGYDDGRGYLES